MDEDGSNNNSKYETSQSSEESHEIFQRSDELESFSKDENAWLRLKTITTFDSDTSTRRFMNELCSTESKTSTSNLSNFCKLEEKLYDREICGGQHHIQAANCIYERSFDTKDQRPINVQNNENLCSPDNDFFPESEAKHPLPQQKKERRRRRSQSNSLSEGNFPLGAETDPSSHFSVTSSALRNGTVSDVGADRTNTSLGSHAPAPVQSLTRFSPTSLLVESLIDQLCKIMEKDSGKQRKLYHVICKRLHEMQLIDNTYNIDEFQFMRSYYQKALYQFLAVAKSSTQPSDSRNILLPLPSSTMNVDTKFTSEQILEWSRYQHEYHELEYLAKGGFGRVYKVRNKLDGGEYAIKKILLRYRYIQGFLRSLKEVKMLARLNHPNIVSYKAAWLEPLDDGNKKCNPQKPSTSSSSFEASVSIFSLHSNSRLPLPPAPVSKSDDSIDIVFQDSSHDNRSSCSQSPEAKADSTNRELKTKESFASSTCPLPGSNSSDSLQHDGSTDEMESSRSSGEGAVCPLNQSKHRKRNDSSSTAFHNWATLYVQMQLCERTLRQWLDARNDCLPAHPLSPSSSEGILALDLFRKIVSGVDYIHTQGIVHHDIKPSNIFVNGTLKEVQVGDFGLSCCILSRVDSSGIVGEHHGEVGTRMYAAPEQLRGKCTSKSDLYSLGIVLLELLHPFHTDMERSKVIQKLRAGHLPSELSASWPHVARLISDLLVVSAVLRPPADKLLQRVDSLLHSNEEIHLSSQLAAKDETIKLLQETVASRDQEIAELRQRLSLFLKKESL